MQFNLLQVLDALKTPVYTYTSKGTQENRHHLNVLKLYQFSLAEKTYISYDFLDEGVSFTPQASYPLKTLSTDSRAITEDHFFLALKGERFDGNHFLTSLFEQGLSLGIGTAPFESLYPQWMEKREATEAYSSYYIQVNNSTLALGKLAHAYRTQCEAKVLAITGSVGKTSVREMVAAALSNFGTVHKTKANLNNEIGTASTLLNTPVEANFTVLELGMDRPGDLAYLSPLVQADAVFLTNIGYSHMEYFESLTQLAHSKAEILSGLKEKGRVFVQAKDDTLVHLAQSHFKGYLQEKQLIFLALLEEQQALTDIPALKQAFELLQQNEASALYLGRYRKDIQEGIEEMDFSIFKREEDKLEEKVLAKSIRLPQLVGRHHFENACYGLAFVHDFFKEADEKVLEKAIQGLQNYEVVGSRQKWQIAEGVHCLDDAYNASLSSFLSAFESFFLKKNQVEQQSDKKGKAIGVFGGILELGNYAQSLHERLGEAMAKEAFDFIFLLGEESAWIEKTLLTQGYPQAQILRILDAKTVEEQLFSLVEKGDFVLFKASHRFQLSQICENLVKYLNELKNT